MRDFLDLFGLRPAGEAEALWEAARRAAEDEREAEDAMDWTLDREALEMLALQAEAARRRHAYYTRLWREMDATREAPEAEIAQRSMEEIK